MDRKSLIILLASFALLMLWYPLTNRLFPPTPLPVQTNAAPTQLGGTLTKTDVTNVAEAPTPAITPTAPRKRAATSEETVAIENEHARYTFTSHGGGLKLVELKEYPAVVECRKKSATNAKQLATLNTGAPEPILAMLGNEGVQGDGVYKLTKVANGLRADKVLSNGLSVVKEF